TTEPQATTKPAESTTKADESSTTEKATTKKKSSTTTTKATVAKTTARAKTTAAKTATSSSTITLEKAKSIALKKAGVSASGVTFTTASKWDDGNYHIAFYNSSKKFSFIISASGTVLSSDTTPNTTTTKKKTTTVKNVTAKEVQNEVNAYIRSKGITVDSSLRPNNSGWSGQISDRQDSLNDGTTLKHCKAYVDMEISSMGTAISLYCYYDGNDFYILYL
ncbi:MAG: hypothetical protein ACI4IK_02750, partial [Eubacterium sp.]